MVKDSNARFEQFQDIDLVEFVAAGNSQHIYRQNIESFLYSLLNTQLTAGDNQYFLKHHNIRIV